MSNPDFSKLWSSGSSLTPYEFSDADYLKGWETVGGTPPARTMFDALQRNNDLKAKNLNDRTVSIEDLLSAQIIKRGEEYSVDDTAMLEGIPAGYFLECTTAGTTGATAPVITSPVTEGYTINDGTVVWTVRKTNSISNTLNMGVFNHKETFTSSGSFTAPTTGVYRITLQGGGGGGGGANIGWNGNGGSSGAKLTDYVQLTQGTSYSFVVGAGGAGGIATQDAADGGAASITVGTDILIANGGIGGHAGGPNQRGAASVTATKNGVVVAYSCCGEAGGSKNGRTAGGNGGGEGGGVGRPLTFGLPGDLGGGGGAGGTDTATNNIFAGGNGGDGYITFEYCDI